MCLDPMGFVEDGENFILMPLCSKHNGHSSDGVPFAAGATNKLVMMVGFKKYDDTRLAGYRTNALDRAIAGNVPGVAKI